MSKQEVQSNVKLGDMFGSLPEFDPLPDPSDMDGAQYGYTPDDVTNYAIDQVEKVISFVRKNMLQDFLRAKEWAERCGEAQAEADALVGAINRALKEIESAGFGDGRAAQILRVSISKRLADALCKYRAAIGN